MGDHFPGWGRVLRGLAKDKKRNILLIFILAVTAGLFFSVLFRKSAFAQKTPACIKTDLAMLDPMEKIGKSLLKFKKDENFPRIYNHNSRSTVYESLVQGHPIEGMIPSISRKEKAVAAFLIGIAKKESDWGKHSPRKNGRDCYNYWGYRGTYNATDSGYSCFDSPEQAVDEVGRRIEKLMSQKINTPERMIVWKCGSSCAGHDPYSVKKWISDVSLYYNKLDS